MIMRARKDAETLFFELEGHLDFDTTQQFEEACTGMITKIEDAKVVFNLAKLKFVGSSGINHFIKVLKDFNRLGEKPRYCGLSSEFEKIFRAFETSRNPFEIFETEDLAIKSFVIVKKAPPPKKRTKTRK